MKIDPTLYKGRPTDTRIPKEERCYELLDRLCIEYCRADHEHADTIEQFQEIEKQLGAASKESVRKKLEINEKLRELDELHRMVDVLPPEILQAAKQAAEPAFLQAFAGRYGFFDPAVNLQGRESGGVYLTTIQKFTED